MRLAAALLLALAGAARAEVIERRLGPFELKGRTGLMAGPEAVVEQRFEKPGYITAFSASLKDKDLRSRDHEGLHCHSSLDSGQLSQRFARQGLRAEESRLVLNEGLGELRFPEGFGLPVAAGRAYALQGMLEDDDGTRSGSYTVDYRIELAPAEPRLKALTGLLVLIRSTAEAAAHAHCDSSVWSVPPGRHSYEKPFTMPYGARVHLIAAHLHRYVRALEIVEAATGKPAYRAEVALNAQGYPLEVPVYSSAEGLPLRKGARYLFRVVYDNPTAADSPGAGALRLYLREDPS
jgi:hypothetical protein